MFGVEEKMEKSSLMEEAGTQWEQDGKEQKETSSKAEKQKQRCERLKNRALQRYSES